MKFRPSEVNGRDQASPGFRALLAILLALSLSCGSFASAQEPDAGEKTESRESLSTKQEALSLRYRRFQSTLLQLAEYLRQTDPDRAELLVRALGKSKETRIDDQLAELVKLLDSGQLGDAIDGQESVMQHMQLVLALLQSEDRQSELQQEQERIQALIRDVDKLIGKQTDARAATERGGPAERAADQQRKVSEQTQDVINKIRQQDSDRSPDSSPRDSQPQDGSNPDGSSRNSDSSGKPADGSSAPKDGNNGESPQDGQKPGEKPADGDPSRNKPKDNPGGKPGDKSKDPADQSPMKGDSGSPMPESPDPQSPPEESDSNPSPPGQSQSGKSKPGSSKPGKSQPGQPQEGQPQEGQPQEDGQQGADQDAGEQPSSPDGEPQDPTRRPTPGRSELEQAREQMERAIEELKKQQRSKASEEQDRALAELLKAKEKLEEILRQLREEEQELLLAALEARFRDMLARQINVFNGTVGVAAVPMDQRSDRQRGRAIELARAQDEVALLAAKVLTLLKEEGSSIAFPEAVIQIRDDMQTSARRLERLEVGELTQGIQKDIIESLEEMLEALQKEMEKSKDKKQQQQQGQQGQQQDPALVDALAELRMLRSLQYRVNRRTKQLGRLVEGEQADDPDLVQQLRELSARQAKIQRTAYDLSTGKNQ